MAGTAMPKGIIEGRFAAKMECDFVVFLIGMRINEVHKFHRWMPVTRHMPRMIAELQQHPELGFLHSDMYRNGRTVVLVQYWRSYDALHAYSHAKEGLHLAAWVEFNRLIRNNSSVGIFHESYLVRAGEYECVYANMPLIGLARAGEMVPATGHMQNARGRLNPPTA